MIFLLHGDDTAASRSYLSIRKAIVPHRTLFGHEIDMTTLVQAFESDSLFGATEVIFIEELITGKKHSSELDSLLAYLSARSAETDIYLWEGKDVTKSVISKLKHVTARQFKLPQAMFQFLDSIRPGNTHMVRLFHEALSTTEPELIFYMLVRHFRLLLALGEHEATIDEVKRLAPWQRSKLKKQSGNFSREALLSHYTTLHEIDLAQKTGAASLPLAPSIDIFLMNL